MISQCRDHYDIIVDPLINKEFLIKKFFYQFEPIAFCLLGRNTYNPKFHRSFLFSHFQPNLFFKIFTMGNNQRRRFFTNKNHTASKNKQEQLYQQLTEALNTLGAYFTEVRRLQVELTSQLFSSELNIGWWQARYTQEHRRYARAST